MIEAKVIMEGKKIKIKGILVIRGKEGLVIDLHHHKIKK